MKRLVSGIFLLLLVGLLLPLSAVVAYPVPSQFFSGTATLDGSPAPDGTPVTATFDPASGYWLVSTTTSGGSYSLLIPDVGSAENTDTGSVIFTLDGLSAGSTPFVSGDVTTFDISATSPPTTYDLIINTTGNGSTTGAGTYNEDDLAPITATADPGWVFVNWTGDAVADANADSTTILMDADKTVTANFAAVPTFDLTVLTSGNGSTTGAGTYNEDDLAPITATADPGWVFVNWTGDAVADANASSTTILMDADKTVTANFAAVPTFDLTVLTSGNGSTTGAGTYNEDDLAPITATADPGWVFVNWTGDAVADANASSTTILMDADKTVTANFAAVPTFDLTVLTSGNGSTTGAGTYNEDDLAPITATADPGWVFVNWTGDAVADANASSTTILMDADKTVTANFAAVPTFDLTVLTSGNGSTTGAGTYNEDDLAPITATADPGWVFVNWTGDAVADANASSTTILMDADKTVTANFAAVPTFDLTVLTSGNGSTTGAGTYNEDDLAPITATADPGWVFVNWTGDAVADANADSTTILMDADKTVTANFAAVPTFDLTVLTTGNGSTTGAGTYNEDDLAPITATADPGWVFVNWTGDAVADANASSTTILMDADKTVTANFAAVPTFDLTVLTTGNGSTTGAGTYNEDDLAPITATADPGWVFVNWTGDAVADANADSTTILMDADKTVTANFIETDDITLTIAVNGSGTTNPAEGAHSYTEGTVVTITATPSPGWVFDSWTGDVADISSETTTVTMDVHKTITANFISSGDITPPVISEASAGNVTETTADISWTTDEPSDSQVDYAASPGELTPLDPALVTQHLVTLSGLSPATTYTYTVRSRDATGNLTVSGESTFTTLGAAATLIPSEWNANITNNDGGLQVIVSLQVDNTGDIAGSYELTLMADNLEVETKQVDLAPGTSENIAFNTVNDISGKFTVTADGTTVLFSLEVPESAAGIAWWLLVLTAIGVAAVTAILVILMRKRALVSVGTKGEFQFPSLSPKYTTTTNELEETKLEAEEAKRAWREAQEARVEAEEAKAAVTKAATEAITEAKETTNKSKRELEDYRKLAQEAATAKRLYGEARIEAEEAKRAWVKAHKARKAGHSDERAKIEAQESEDRAARLIRKVEVGNTEAGEDKIEVYGMTVTVRALEKLKESLSIQSKDPAAVVRIVDSPTVPNQFEMILGSLKADDRVLEREGQKILAFSWDSNHS